MLYNTENPHGGDIYKGGIILDFSANINPFGLPEGVKKAIAESIPLLERYPDPYCRRLVSAIAAHEGVKEEYLLVGSGAAEIIYSFAFSEKPRLAVELAPTFSEYTLPLQGAQIERFYLKEENGFRLTDGFLEFVGRIMPDTVFLCSPNNPTGLALEPALLKKTAELCEKIGARLFLDECFMDLSDAGESLVPLIESNRNLFILKAFTKSYGMAGVRLGYALSSDTALFERMSKTVQPWNVSTIAQAAGAAALSENAFLEKTRAHIKSERARLAAGLKALGFKVFDSNANYILFKGEAGLYADLAQKGIKIRCCANFHGLSSGFYRIAVKLEHENEMLLAALRTIAEEK